MSRPLQVHLDDAERKRLEAWVRRKGWTMSQAVRVALRALSRSPEEDPLLSASGMVEGLPPDLSEQVDRYLAETFVASPGRGIASAGPSPLCVDSSAWIALFSRVISTMPRRTASSGPRWAAARS